MPGNLLIKQSNDHQIKLKGQYLQAAYLPAKPEAPNGLLFELKHQQRSYNCDGLDKIQKTGKMQLGREYNRWYFHKQTTHHSLENCVDYHSRITFNYIRFLFVKEKFKIIGDFFFLLLLFGVQKGLKQYQQPLDLFRALTSGNLNIFHYFGRNYSLSHFRIGP